VIAVDWGGRILDSLSILYSPNALLSNISSSILFLPCSSQFMSGGRRPPLLTLWPLAWTCGPQDPLYPYWSSVVLACMPVARGHGLIDSLNCFLGSATSLLARLNWMRGE